MRYSEQQAFNSCPYKYKLTHIDKLAKHVDDRSVHHKTWGQAIHKGLEAHYKGESIETVKDEFLKIYPENLDDSDLAKTVEGGLLCLEKYIVYYAEQDKQWEVIATELEGLTDLNGGEHGLHIDALMRNKQSGELYLWDHKTSGRAPSHSYWRTYEISSQITRYTDYVKRKFGSCAGALVNNIVIGHRKRAYKGEMAGHWFRFERQLFNRTEDQIKFWRASDQGWIKLIEHCKATDNWPKQLGSLCPYCEFYELCLASGDEQIKELMYRAKVEDEFSPEVV